MSAGSRPDRFYVIAGLVWFLVAVVVGASGMLLQLPAPWIQAILLLLTLGLIVAAWLDARFRAWLDSCDLSAVIAIHLSRFVGVYFLLLYDRGLLPFEFAVVGGIGDIAVALAALALLILRPDPVRSRSLLWWWNVLGLVDILLVVLTAGRIGRHDPAALAPLRYLPLSLLPTFLVPIIIGSHLLIFRRLRRKAVV